MTREFKVKLVLDAVFTDEMNEQFTELVGEYPLEYTQPILEQSMAEVLPKFADAIGIPEERLGFSSELIEITEESAVGGGVGE